MSNTTDKGGEGQAKTMGEAAGENVGSAGELRDAASQVAQKAMDATGQAAQHIYQQAREAAQEWERSLGGYVRQNPLVAVLLAAGIGLAVGCLLLPKE